MLTLPRRKVIQINNDSENLSQLLWKAHGSTDYLYCVRVYVLTFILPV